MVITGDGSFNMAANELSVWRQHNLIVTLHVLDNLGYACIRRTQNQYCDGRRIGIHWGNGLPATVEENIADAYDYPVNVIHCRQDQEFFTP